MTKKWEICERCKGDGYTHSYCPDGYDDDEPLMISCHACNGSGKVPYRTEEEAAEDLEDRKLALLENGIAPGTDEWNEALYH